MRQITPRARPGERAVTRRPSSHGPELRQQRPTDTRLRRQPHITRKCKRTPAPDTSPIRTMKVSKRKNTESRKRRSNRFHFLGDETMVTTMSQSTSSDKPVGCQTLSTLPAAAAPRRRRPVTRLYAGHTYTCLTRHLVKI